MKYSFFFCFFYFDYVERSSHSAGYDTPFSGRKRLDDNLECGFSFHDFLDSDFVTTGRLNPLEDRHTKTILEGRSVNYRWFPNQGYHNVR